MEENGIFGRIRFENSLFICKIGKIVVVEKEKQRNIIYNMKVLANPHIQKSWYCIMEQLPRIKKLKHIFFVQYL